jgi:prepilin-type N-terminal cleavage/methylation domain-containing protein
VDVVLAEAINEWESRMKVNSTQRKGFSLIELVIVVVIIGIIAAIAIPKLSRGAAGASDSALSGDLKVLRTALDMYATEHGGSYPTVTQITNGNLIGYSDDAGTFSATKDGTHIYCPYLRVVPNLPVGAKKGASGIDVVANAGTATVGWIYDNTTGKIYANTTLTEADARGNAYTGY